VSWIDVVIVVLVFFAALRGWRLGALAQLGIFVGRIVGFLVGVKYAPVWSAALTHGRYRGLLALLLVIAAGSVGSLIGRFLGKRLAKAVPFRGFETADAFLGLLASVLGVLIICWLIGTVVTDVHLASLSKEVDHSLVLGYVQRVMPSPPTFVAQFRPLMASVHIPNIAALVYHSLSNLLHPKKLVKPTQ
jgi:CDP-diglyceride synthetase